jgi:hypothetical protein
MDSSPPRPQSLHLRRLATALGAAAVLVAIAGAQSAAAQSAGELFPQPFVVEHQVMQRDADGTSFLADPVTSYYAGSRIVSVRGDGSRLVVDLARRELTEVQPKRSAYWTLSFDRFAELRQRLAAVQGNATAPRRPTGPPGQSSAAATAEAAPAALRVEDVALGAAAEDAALPALPEAARALLGRAGVRRLRVSATSKAGTVAPALEVWVDPTVRLGAAAVEALARFEEGALGGAGAAAGPGATTSRLLAEARRQAGGAVPVRTSRSLVASDGRRMGSLDDVALRVETLPALPADLLAVPAGFRRMTPPLEAMVAFAEDDAARRSPMTAASEEQR